jgi:hypothetical protein
MPVLITCTDLNITVTLLLSISFCLFILVCLCRKMCTAVSETLFVVHGCFLTYKAPGFLDLWLTSPSTLSLSHTHPPPPSLWPWEQFLWDRPFEENVRGLTIKFMNSPPCACCGSSGQKPQYGLMTLAYQRITAVLCWSMAVLSEWCLLLSACVLVCRRENAGASCWTWQEWKRNQRDVSASLCR